MTSTAEAVEAGKQSNRLLRAAFAAVLVLAVTVLILAMRSNPTSNAAPVHPAGVTGAAAATTYETVVLANGKVFFGHVKSNSAKALVLTDVFELTPPTVSDPAGRLVRHSDLADGSTGPVTINPAQVAYMDVVAPTSEVAKGITKIKSGG